MNDDWNAPAPADNGAPKKQIRRAMDGNVQDEEFKLMKQPKKDKKGQNSQASAAGERNWNAPAAKWNAPPVSNFNDFDDLDAEEMLE